MTVKTSRITQKNCLVQPTMFMFMLCYDDGAMNLDARKFTQ